MFALRQVLREHQDKQLRLALTNCDLIDLDALLAAASGTDARARGRSLTVSSAPPLIEDT